MLGALAGCSSPTPEKAAAPTPRGKRTATASAPADPRARRTAARPVGPGDSRGADLAAAANEDPAQPLVRIETSLGTIELRLHAHDAPQTVANFLEYVDAGEYDGSIVHQVVEGYLILAGGYDQHLVEQPARAPITNEATHSRSNRRGTVAMARQLRETDSATRQFFFNLADNRLLDHQGDEPEEFGYCVFGEVVSGWEVIEAMSRVPVHNQGRLEMLPREPIVLLRVTRCDPDAPSKSEPIVAARTSQAGKRGDSAPAEGLGSGRTSRR